LTTARTISSEDDGPTYESINPSFRSNEGSERAPVRYRGTVFESDLDDFNEFMMEKQKLERLTNGSIGEEEGVVHPPPPPPPPPSRSNKRALRAKLDVAQVLSFARSMSSSSPSEDMMAAQETLAARASNEEGEDGGRGALHESDEDESVSSSSRRSPALPNERAQTPPPPPKPPRSAKHMPFKSAVEN
jgi:hypothetical protein